MNLSNLPSSIRKIVFIVDGGIGKNLMATAVVRAIKKKYLDKQIIVICGYPEIFMYNPNVARLYNFKDISYFYEDYVNEETIIIREEPYMSFDYINKRKHLVECWCNMIGVECDGIYPDFYYLETELDLASEFVKTRTKGKKLALLQWVGGIVPNAKNKESFIEVQKRMYIRSLPQSVAQEVANYLKEKDYYVMDVSNTNFPDLEGVEKTTFTLRATILLLTQADLFVGIDSFMQHASASNQIKKSGIIFWAGTSPKVLGYDIHKNIERKVCPTPQCHRPNSFLFDMTPYKPMWECPYNEICKKYKSEEIIKIIEEEIK